jgi:thioredoxin reductase (NADPH)
MKSAIIIGGGPAGCQCALWLHLLGYEVIIAEQTDKLGGLQNRSVHINNWLVGVMGMPRCEIAKNIQRHIEQLSIPVYFNSTIKSITNAQQGFKVQIGSESIHAHNIVIATGVRPRNPNFVEGENIIIGPGIKVTHHPFVNKRVAILGGGDNAAENYSFVSKQEPELCHVYARTVRARESLWNQVNIDHVYQGDYYVDQKSMTVTYQDVKRSYDVFVVLYGWEANFPPELASLKSALCNEQGFINVDNLRRTNVPNIFAIGEVTNYTYPCVVTAMADGVIAAKAIQTQLENTSFKQI